MRAEAYGRTVRPSGKQERAVVGEVAGDGGEGEAGEASDEEQGNEERRPKRIADPRKPSQAEVEEHELTHLPFRSWCSKCVQGKPRTARTAESRRRG